jgi:hypothetical protein
MHAAKLAALEQAKRLSACLIRVDEIVDSGRFELDDVRAVSDLEQMGRGIARRMYSELKRPFLSRRSTRSKPNKAMHPRHLSHRVNRIEEVFVKFVNGF